MPMAKAVQLKDKNGNKVFAAPWMPIGSIYISVINQNPSNYFGGTWEQFANGRTLVGVDTSQTEFNSVEKTGGEKKHTLSVDELAEHAHTFDSIQNNDTQPWQAPYQVFEYKYVAGTKYTATTTTSGRTLPHNNLQPYITVYMWKRIS